MIKIRTLIVEDEEPAREIVKTYLKKYSEIELLGECADGFTAVKTINELKPDLLFLDIQLPKLTGFEILELIEHIPVIIFTTGWPVVFTTTRFLLRGQSQRMQPLPV